MGTIFWLMVVAVVVLAVANKTALGNVWSAINAQVSKWGRTAKEADPVALLQHEIDAATEEVRGVTGQLEESRGLVASLERQTLDCDKEVAVAKAKLIASLKDDPADKSGKAAKYAVDLKTAETRLALNQSQWEQAKKVYAGSLKKVQLARDRIKTAKERAGVLKLTVKMSETDSQMSRLAQSMNVNVGGLDSKMKEAEELIQKRIDKNNAVSAVQADLGIDGVAEAEEAERLRQAEGQATLEEYRKKLGIG